MVRSLGTLLLGVVVAAALLAIAVVSSIGIILIAAQVALFGDSKRPWAAKILDRVIQNLSKSKDIEQ